MWEVEKRLSALLHQLSVSCRANIRGSRMVEEWGASRGAGGNKVISHTVQFEVRSRRAVESRVVEVEEVDLEVEFFVEEAEEAECLAINSARRVGCGR